MDTQNPSAPPRAQSAPADNPARSRHHTGGVIHENTRHTTRFVVIGNHLTQHKELSLLAIGLGCHIQSLPTGTPADIKSLASRFKEGTTRIAAALRELETHGYLRRERVRTATGRIITRTISCNQPGHRREPTDTGCPTPPRTAHRPEPRPRKALPAVPQPTQAAATALHQQATDLLTGLRRHDPRLLLSATDTAHLAPGVIAWLEREVTPTTVRHALTTDLPDDPLRRPAALLAHRLTAQLPPPPPYRTPAAAPPPVRHKLRTCDTCDRAFRAPETETHCRDCRPSTVPAQNT
ncbi:helix-turn-helix domain-containing protein [Streptomyces sp. I4(2020)]|uniref:helix-turn-helix domain-containing protein n=1 Tax=Streptomyces sp. I4(2020) TaxID=2760981 RepID=UPI0018EE617D|nr:helix-turn-helix domain-containing protein [Streptomyces sp. I4(2020)]MBJ6626665.1 helix-turn-helix domain-containing protein [Streptomyces sp. I4(2020)]